MGSAGERAGGAGRTSRRWYLMPAAVLCMGILSIALLLWIDRIKEKQRSDRALADAVADVQVYAASSHLWLEEALTGDATVDTAAIIADLDESVAAADLILNGGISDGGLRLRPLEDRELRSLVEAIRPLLAELRALTVERLSRPGTSGVGTPLDERFDGVFRAFLEKADSLRAIVDRRHARSAARSGRLSSGILFLWTSCVAVALIGLWGRELQRKRAQDALYQANDTLERQVEERTRELSSANTQLRAEVAERRQTEIALRESEAKFRLLSEQFHTALNAIPDSIIVVSPELRILWTNRGAAVAAGKTVSEMVGRYCYEIWHQRSEPCAGCPVIRSLLSGRAESAQVSSADGSTWDMRCFPVKNLETNEYNVIEIAAAVTRRAT